MMKRESRTCVSKSWSFDEATTSALTERWKSVTSSGRSSISRTSAWTSGWFVVMALQICLRMVVLPRARRGHDQAARALADGRDEVNDARLDQIRIGFELELFDGVNRREIFKADGLGVFLKGHVVDLFNGLELRAGAAMRRLRRPVNQAALAQKAAPDGVGRDKDVRRLRMIMVLRGAQKPEAFFGNLQIAGAVVR